MLGNNSNLEIFNRINETDEKIDAHANNFADKYNPDLTYVAGDLRIYNNALWRAKQNIDVAEPWTESHWESTNITEVIGSVYSSLNSRIRCGTATINYDGNSDENYIDHNCGFNDTNYVILYASRYYSVIPAMAKPVDGNRAQIKMFDWSITDGGSPTDVRIISSWASTITVSWVAIKL